MSLLVILDGIKKEESETVWEDGVGGKRRSGSVWLLGSTKASSASSQLSLSSFNFSTQLPFVSSLDLHREPKHLGTCSDSLKTH